MLRNKLYYRIKPLVPKPMRLAIRRIFARRRRSRYQDTWPVLPGSEEPPRDWPGWPDGKKFALVLTHDVESQTGVDKCEQLMDVEKALGFRSSFTFVPRGDYRVSRALRGDLANNGFEIAVHDLHHDGKLFHDREDFVEKAGSINKYLQEWGAVGFRSAFMLRNLDWLHELQVQYDSSTFDTDPFEPQPDGVGTIFPFWVPKPAVPSLNGAGENGHDRTSPLINGTRTGHGSNRGYVELPYTLPQDSTLFLLFGERTPDIWYRKLDWIAKHGGMALMDVHPDYMRFNGEEPAKRTFPAHFYGELLEYARKRYGDSFWHPLPREMAEFAARLKPRLKRAYTWKGKRAAVVLYGGYPSDPRPRRELHALVEEGASVDLICLQENSKQVRQECLPSIRVTRLPFRHERSGKIRYFWQYSRFFVASFVLLSVRCVRARYQVVHIHNMPDVLAFSALVPRLLGSKIALDLHDPMPELCETIFKLQPDSQMVRLLKRLEKWSIELADVVLTPNEAFRKLFCSRSCPPQKLRIIMNAPDERIFRPPQSAAALPADGRQSAEFRLMYHGLIVERHGLMLAVEALKRVERSSVKIVLDMYGERTPYADKVVRTGEEFQLGDRLRYHGWRPLEDIPAAILQSDIGIIPNPRTPFTEINFPTRIFEYLAMGKPVIVPDTQGIRDYFDDTQIVFFKPNSADDLARAIRWAYENPKELESVLFRGRQVYERHCWQTYRSVFLDTLAELMTSTEPLTRGHVP